MDTILVFVAKLRAVAAEMLHAARLLEAAGKEMSKLCDTFEELDRSRHEHRC